MPATPVWLAAIESVLNRSIGGSQQAQAAARRLDRSSVQVDIEGIARIRASICANSLALASGGELDADAVIAGSPFALLSFIAAGGGRAVAAVPDRGRSPVRISGDAEVAGGYRELFALARPDLEEELSRLIGDLPARRFSLGVQGIVTWARKLGRTAGENIAEYLQEESRDLAGRYEVEEFVQGVDRLRDTAERVEARLARLEQRLKGGR